MRIDLISGDNGWAIDAKFTALYELNELLFFVLVPCLTAGGFEPH